MTVAFIATACRDESPSVSGPTQAEPIAASPLKVFPPNGGVMPEVISSIAGEMQIDSFSFETDPPASDYREVEGGPWGIWFGDQNILSEDPPTGNQSWTYCGNHYLWTGHSGSRCISQFNVPRSARLYFDPPVRSISFWYASDLRDGDYNWEDSIPDDAFYFVVRDTTGSTVVFDSIRANQNPPDSWAADLPRDDWTRVAVSTGDEDRIGSVYFNGLMIIDDLVIARKGPPGIECTEDGTGEPEMTRGNVVVCSITDTTGVESVSEWRFEGENAEGVPLPPITNTAHDSVAWSGIAVAAGEVSATLVRNENVEVVTGSLQVTSRSGTDWRWSEADWEDFVQGGAPSCAGLFPKLQISTEDIIVGIHMHANYCLPGKVVPPPHQDPLSPTTRMLIADAGPNDGLWYVLNAAYGMATASGINPSLLNDYLPLDDLHNKDKKQCQQQGNPLQQANLYKYNELCRIADVDAWISGIWLHEGWGSTGLNGHESQLRQGAIQEENDPVAAVESLVEVSEQELISAITAAVEIVDGDLHEATDPNHVVVRNNFPQMTFWLLNPGNGKFKEKEVDDVP